MNTEHPHNVHKTIQDFGRRSSRVEIKEKNRYKSKAISEQYDLKEREEGSHKTLEELELKNTQK